MKRKSQAGKRAIRHGKISSPHTPSECKHFTGYKPCFPGTRCYETCVDYDPIGTRILLINLDAMGNVLVTTTILPAIKKRYPESTITWLTEEKTAPLLQDNPYIDRVMAWTPEGWLILNQLEFDVVMNVDKSVRSGAMTMAVRSKQKMGFGINGNGQIIPLNPEARENYLLGLDDQLKFKENIKTVSHLECEEFALPYQRDEYVLTLTAEERAFCDHYMREHGLDGGKVIVGLNTGCSELFPNKKMTIDQHVVLIERLSHLDGVKILLLGGPEDTQRNAEIARLVGERVHSTPTTEGVRRGICYENLCDMVITGDSFGMHLAIALGKFVIVWFGVSSPNEIDLFDRGTKLVPEGLSCSPCWKQTCPYNLECIQMIDLERIVDEVKHFTASRFGRGV
jgi:ADP-heptose:LPS heptosyltransferase